MFLIEDVFLYIYINVLCMLRCGGRSVFIEKNNNAFHLSFSGRLNIYNILEDISYEPSSRWAIGTGQLNCL